MCTARASTGREGETPRTRTPGVVGVVVEKEFAAFIARTNRHQSECSEMENLGSSH
jgi:hypothetical protein